MPDTNTSLTRQELFDLVWTKPVTHIAKEFGVQPALVLKACELLNVPRPTTGHWVKVDHGQVPPPPALPQTASGVHSSINFGQIMGRRRRLPKEKPVAVNSPEVAADAQVKWHATVQKTRSAYRGGDVDRKYGTLYPKLDYSHLSLSVTRGCLDRGLQLLNQLAWLLENNGFSFEAPEKESTQIRLVYTATGTGIGFFIKEGVERYERELKPEEKNKDPLYIWDRWQYRPTGKLRLIISEYYPQGARKSWGDGKNTRLEDKLADAAPDFVICAQGKHAQEVEWAARQLRWDQEARLRRESEERKRKEDERRAILCTAAKNWSDAEVLKAFRGACEARLRSTAANGILSEQQDEWLQWVDLVITETNPISAGFLKRLEGVEDLGAKHHEF